MLEELLWASHRNAQEELRIYRKDGEGGEPSLEISVWQKRAGGWQRLRYFTLKRSDARAILGGLSVALQELGVTLRPEEQEASKAE